MVTSRVCARVGARVCLCVLVLGCECVRVSVLVCVYCVGTLSTTSSPLHKSTPPNSG